MKKLAPISDHNAVIARIMAHDEARARRLIQEAARAKRLHYRPLAAISLRAAWRGLWLIITFIIAGATIAFAGVWIFTLFTL